MDLRISVDTGGTFTDVVVADADDRLWIGKALSTRRGVEAIFAALEDIADRMGTTKAALLGHARELRYGTTIATNAIVERKTARTAFFTTHGFPDILLLREGGKPDAFRRLPYPAPYVPRHLTYEVRERVTAEGAVEVPLDEGSVIDAIDAAVAAGCEAIGVCLLWSIANPAHERRIGELIAERAPQLMATLSYELNPVIREYRRASSTVIDASLKPLVQGFFSQLEGDLRRAGLAGNFLVSTSYGGTARTAEVLAAPIKIVASGPAMAPVAAKVYSERDLGDGVASDLLVCDTGGTSFDVSIVSSGELTYTSETWLGGRWIGHITGTRAVDVQSIGAGGGSIAWVDEAGLIRVGPRSAGAEPGPACYGGGGTEPTVTDAALILGYLDETNFLGGRMPLDRAAAIAALARLGGKLGMGVEETADATMVIVAQNIVSAIRQITIANGIDTRTLTLVAGGGASGLNIAQVARELQSPQVLLPRTASAMSACGALFADLATEFAISRYFETRAEAVSEVNDVLAELAAMADRFVSSLDGVDPGMVDRSFSVAARYPRQVWELDVPLEGPRVDDPAQLRQLERAFDRAHERAYAVSQPGQHLECLVWKVRVSADLGAPRLVALSGRGVDASPYNYAPAYFRALGTVSVPCYDGASLDPGATVTGPALIYEPTTTVVVPPGTQTSVTDSGSYVLRPTTNPASISRSEREAVRT